MRAAPFISRIALIHACAAALLASTAGAADAAGTWGCRASGGWVSAGGQVAEPLVAAGGSPCAATRADSASPAGISFAKPLASTSSGQPGATTDTQKPVAEMTADSVVIENGDRSLRVSARAVRARAAGACSSSRVPGLDTSSGLRDVTVNGRPISADQEFSEPGVGVNGAPLFGRLRIRFGEVAAEGDAEAGSQRVLRRALHVVVTDSGGAIVFEAVAGEVAVTRDGRVCDPPPVCPDGQKLDPRANECVDVDVQIPAPPPPPPGTPPLPPGTEPPLPIPPGPPPRHPVGCASASARPGSASATRLRSAIVCLVNAQRSKRRLRRLRVNDELELAARRHARDMVVRRYFSHTNPSGAGVLDRLLRTRYLRRYGRWRVGEVLGWGWGAQGSPAAIVAGWMRSPAHRRQLLGRYSELGVGVQRAAPRRMSRPASTFVVEFGSFDR